MHGRVIDVFDVTIYNDPLGSPALPRLQLIRPDGAELRSLGEGEAPAWTPDSDQVVFTRGGNLWRSNLDGTSEVLIANTNGAREVAVSPDGAWVAFTRLNPGNNKRDVWVAPL
jgi:hypothetical protein